MRRMQRIWPDARGSTEFAVTRNGGAVAAPGLLVAPRGVQLHVERVGAMR